MSDIAVGVDIASELDRTVISQRPEIDIKPLAAAIMDMAERDKGLTMMGLEELIEDYLYQPIDMGALPQATHDARNREHAAAIKEQQTAIAEALYKAAVVVPDLEKSAIGFVTGQQWPVTVRRYERSCG